jgi:hypothetical protein
MPPFPIHNELVLMVPDGGREGGREKEGNLKFGILSTAALLLCGSASITMPQICLAAQPCAV